MDFVDAYAAIRGHKVFVAIKRWTPHSHSNGDDAESSEEDLDGADPADLQQGGGVLVDVGPNGDGAGCCSVFLHSSPLPVPASSSPPSPSSSSSLLPPPPPPSDVPFWSGGSATERKEVQRSVAKLRGDL